MRVIEFFQGVVKSRITWIVVGGILVLVLAVVGIRAAFNNDVEPLVEQAQDGGAADSIPDYAQGPMIDLRGTDSETTTCGEMKLVGTTGICNGSEFVVNTGVTEYKFGYTYDPSFRWWWFDSTDSRACTATPDTIECGEFQVIHSP